MNKDSLKTQDACEICGSPGLLGIIEIDGCVVAVCMTCAYGKRRGYPDFVLRKAAALRAEKTA